MSPTCELCQQVGGHLIAQHVSWRVVRVPDVDFPAFYRVVWREHVSEWSHLDEACQSLLMRLVTCVEKVLLTELSPTKINLASLGNQVAHLHWHVVARFDWDSHFPQPIWGSANKPPLVPTAQQRLRLSLSELDDGVRQALKPLLG
jgi:diadenosine tetraphosphate (Ap4A) HIT family hydrolase